LTAKHLTQRRKGTKLSSIFILPILFCFLSTLSAYDLSKVAVRHLQNGLTVMVLEDHEQPLVSTQVLYKVGGRNECVGRTGLAHFMEHMAFRGTKHFSDTQDAVYAVGGEWHGYTWIDETTYFETVPIQYLDTVLQVQADRMSNVLNRPEEVQAEKGTVLTELHSYENDPASVLYDQVVAASFLEHPYRYNVIGWTSDVEKITHEDLVDFYHRYYTPSNAILTVVGDVNTAQLFSLAEKYFGGIPSKQIDTLPRTVEPLQKGERRVYLYGAGKFSYYQITYHAPAATDPDYPAFLLLQAILAGSNGVSFRQSGFAVDVPGDARLAGIGNRITTFFAPTAQPYILNFAGSTDGDPDEIEKEIEKKISDVRDHGVSQQELDHSRQQFLSELVFDIETTEDAAHQIAYFEGIGAFSVLQNLSQTIAAVTVQEIQDAAHRYLRPEQRTIGWFLADTRSPQNSGVIASKPQAHPTPVVQEQKEVVDHNPATPGKALVDKTKRGVPLIVQSMPRTPAAFLRILLPSNAVDGWPANDPVWRYTSMQWRFLKQDMSQTIRKARTALDLLKPAQPLDASSMEDPESRLAFELDSIVGGKPYGRSFHPAAILLVGDIDSENAVKLLKRTFADVAAGKAESIALKPVDKTRTIRMPGKAQSQFGYALLAPSPGSHGAYAYRALLYILTHGYAGRLGKELIGRRGLIYYISSNYNSDGHASWISIRFGVDPDKLDETKSEFERLLHELEISPPTAEELGEAKKHLAGRRVTAFQSNDELTAFYSREWIEYGSLISNEQFDKNLADVTLDQVKEIIPNFLQGVSVTIDTR
jgi:predicted Zn-dependent peptidase